MARLTELYTVVRHGNRWWVSELTDTHYGYFYTVIKELGEFISYPAAKEKCNLMIEYIGAAEREKITPGDPRENNQRRPVTSDDARVFG